MTATDDTARLRATDQQALRQALDALVDAAGTADLRAGCLGDSIRVAAAGRMDYSDDDATAEERRRVRQEPDVRRSAMLRVAVREVHAAALRAAQIADYLDLEDPAAGGA